MYQRVERKSRLEDDNKVGRPGSRNLCSKMIKMTSTHGKFTTFCGSQDGFYGGQLALNEEKSHQTSFSVIGAFPLHLLISDCREGISSGHFQLPITNGCYQQYLSNNSRMAQEGIEGEEVILVHTLFSLSNYTNVEKPKALNFALMSHSSVD